MARFDKIAKVYDGFFIQYYYFLAHREIISFLKKFFKKEFSVLDCACGTGKFLEKLNKMGMDFDLSGIDESKNMIKTAEKKRGNDIEFKLSRIEKIPFPDEKFDLLTIIDAFYYFKDKEMSISECNRVLKKRGYFFIFTPRYDNFFQKFLLGPLAGFSSKVFFFNEEKDSTHLSFEELKKLAEKNDFELVKKKKTFFNWLLLFKKND